MPNECCARLNRRVLKVVDAFSRYAPVLDARFAHRSEDVVRTLAQTCRRSGYPKLVRVDWGSELISPDLDLWAYQQDITLDFPRPRKPTANALIERFNGKFHAESLRANLFLGFESVREMRKARRRHHNVLRPRRAIAPRPRCATPPAHPARRVRSGSKRCDQVFQSWIAPHELSERTLLGAFACAKAAG